MPGMAALAWISALRIGARSPSLTTSAREKSQTSWYFTLKATATRKFPGDFVAFRAHKLPSFSNVLDLKGSRFQRRPYKRY
jgi:hypothetical protein